MRLQSLRQDSSNRRKWVAVLALLAPTVAWSEEVDNQLRLSGGSEELPLRAAENAPPPSGRDKSTELVPLPPELSDRYAAPMSLVGPVSRSAGQPEGSRAYVAAVEDDDQWQPRGSHLRRPASESQRQFSPPLSQPSAPPSTKTGPLNSTFQILATSPATRLSPLRAEEPASDSRAAPAPAPAGLRVAQQADEQESGDRDSQPLSLTDPKQGVSDPEQNEPSDALHASDAGDLDSEEPLDRSDAPQTRHDAQPQSDQQQDADPQSDQEPMEIRRLQLKGGAQDGLLSANTGLSVAEKSGARMTVGDVPLEEASERELEPAEDATPRPAEVRPIQGDRITAAGELILSAGKSGSRLPVLPQTAKLKPTIESGLRYHWDRPEDSAERTHWGMMHSIMVFDKDTMITNRRQRYNAVAWMAGNNPCRNQLLFSRDRQGISVRTGVGLQGHQGQLLAIFGLVNVPLNYPVYAGRRKFAVADILEREKLDCRSGNELTFTLIALAHYADSDTSWVAADGQDWDVQRVIREELSQPIVGAACGGTHRLMGFAHALRRRRAEDKPITNQWDRADRYVNEFVDYTWTLQNRDGSMSTGWFERSEDNGNIDRKIQTTGHMLEFLLSTVPDAQLQSPEMLRTVGYLAGTLHAERGHQWQVGPKGHALRALAMYHRRVFGEPAPWRNQPDRNAAGHATQRSVR